MKPLHVKNNSKGRKMLFELLASGRIFNVTYICPFTDKPVKVNAIAADKKQFAPDMNKINALSIYEMGTGRIKREQGRRVGTNLIPASRIVIIRAGEITFDFREDNPTGFRTFLGVMEVNLRKLLRTESYK
jgi:hypothetical protein